MFIITSVVVMVVVMVTCLLHLDTTSHVSMYSLHVYRVRDRHNLLTATSHVYMYVFSTCI